MKSSAKKKKADTATKTPMPLDGFNYLLIGIGGAIIALGYLLMYAENRADGFLSLYISPILLVGAYALILFALLYRRKK